MKFTNRIVKPRVQKRWKLMYTAFICLIGVNFVAQYVQDAMLEELYGVSASDDAVECEFGEDMCDA